MADTGGASSHLRWADIAMALRYPLLVVLVLTALWGTIGVYLRATYRDAIATGEQSARDLARGLEESIVGGLNAVELSLLFVREAYLHDPDGPDVGAWAKSKPATQGLIMQIAMTDRHGMMTASNIGSGKPVDLSDREHIRVHIDDPGNDFLFVSKPVLGRNSGKWSIQFPRKLFDKDHAFTGVVVASVDPYYLSRFYDSIKPGSGSVVLMGTDRIVRARAPAPEKYIGQLLADGPHYHADAPATGVTRRLANTDGVERIYGYRKLADYPLIVQAGLNISDILEDYALNRQLAVFAGGAGSLLVLLTGLLLHSSDRRLRASRATLRAAVEHVSQGIILIDAHGAVRLVSSQAQAMLGLPDSLIAATPRFSDLVEWQKRQGEFASSAEAMQPILAEPIAALQASVYERKRPDGTVLEIRTTRIPGGGAVRTYTDVTQRARTAQALEAARDAAEAASRARSEFMAVTSHEIRTPLNGVIGAADLLLDASLPPRERHYVQVIRSSGEHLLELLNDILDFSKLEAGRLDLESIAFAPRDLVAQVVESQRAQARSRGITLGVRIAPEVPEALIGDPRRLRQVLLNLVGNGVKFTDHGRVDIVITPEAGSAANLRFEVRDTGIGIAPDALQSLFQEFKQADSSISRRFGGTGLGLSISQRLVMLMGGRIDVRSGAEGSVFGFTLSLPAGQLTAPEPEQTAPRSNEASLRVLLAEDNATNRLVVTRMLERAGHAVQSATNGAEALAAVPDGGFDLILMDMMMPEMDGLAATRAIRALPGAAGHVPIIGLTANASAQDKAACLQAGMNGFASKPITSARLQAEMEKVMGQIEEYDTPVLDQAQLAQLGSELGRETVTELIEMFLEDSAIQMQAIRIHEDDSGHVLREAHALTGSARNVGLARLGDASAALEQALRSGMVSDLAARIDALERLHAQAIAALRCWSPSSVVLEEVPA